MFESIALQGEEREWAEANFIPDPGLSLWQPPLIDFDELATAQRHYRDVLELQAGVMPFEEWLPQRLPEVDPDTWFEYVYALQNMARTLERKFSVELLTAPSLEAQQERPQ